jgi:hypothetical protein
MGFLWLVAFAALVVLGGLGFWRGLRTRPGRPYRGEFIAGASTTLDVDPHAGAPDGHGGGT